MVISALLLPVVTRYASGGVAAKEDAREDRRRLEEALHQLAEERRSGQRWYAELVRVVSTASHERQGRLMDRQISERPDIEVVPGFWGPLEPLETLQQIIARSNQELRDTPAE